MTVTEGEKKAPKALENTAKAACVKGYRAMSGSRLQICRYRPVLIKALRHLRDCTIIFFSAVTKIHIVQYMHSHSKSEFK